MGRSDGGGLDGVRYLSTFQPEHPMHRRQFGRLLIATCLTSAGSAATAQDRRLASRFIGYQASFLRREGGTNVERHNPARCRERFSPCSTFKILNSLIALETGAIPNVDFLIKWDGTQRPISAWNQDHTLRTAFQQSALWYYQEVARRIGKGRMQKHVRSVGYGNQDLSGPLDQFWLGNSLKISAEEQVRFLERLHRRTLPLSRRVMDDVVGMMKLAETPRGILYGKTGTDGDISIPKATLGWFVGWVESGDKTHFFATNLSGGDNPSGSTARRITEEILRSHRLL